MRSVFGCTGGMACVVPNSCPHTSHTLANSATREPQEGHRRTARFVGEFVIRNRGCHMRATSLQLHAIQPQRDSIALHGGQHDANVLIERHAEVGDGDFDLTAMNAGGKCLVLPLFLD